MEKPNIKVRMVPEGIADNFYEGVGNAHFMVCAVCGKSVKNVDSIYMTDGDYVTDSDTLDDIYRAGIGENGDIESYGHGEIAIGSDCIKKFPEVTV